jgi:hypothetical protein
MDLARQPLYEAPLNKTLKTHNLFIRYPNNISFNMLKSSCKWEQDPQIFFGNLPVVNSVSG